MVSEIQSNSKSSETIKFVCSYGGNILPRSTDGKLRYVGGLTRLLSVNRSISFTELMLKLVEFCDYSVTLRCQLPNGDLDTLISIKSEDDLNNIIAEYDQAALISNSNIRAILSPPKSLKQISSSSSGSCSPVKYRLFRRSFSPTPSTAYPLRACYCRGCYLQQNPRVCLNAPCSNCCFRWI